MPLRFNGICIVTKDVPRSASFYEEVLQVEAHGDETFAALDTPGAALSIFSEKGMEQMAPGSMRDTGVGSYTIEFEVDDVDEECERLQRLDVRFVKPPTTQAWGRRSVWFRDPDSNIVNFYQTVSSE